jgi:hypothetical protein
MPGDVARRLYARHSFGEDGNHTALVKPGPGILVLAASLVSVCASLWFYFHDEILLYGDAVAHINIARRVFDSMHPGPLQLGTVWLPLPHVLMIPFLIGRHMWTSGLGASVPSMVAYVFGVLGVYNLVHSRVGKWAAFVSAGVFGLNPNLLYLQSTAMTEPLFVAAFTWAVVYFDRFVRALEEENGFWQLYPPDRSLANCAIALAASMLTRYDGWVFSAVFGIVILIHWWNWRGRCPGHQIARRLQVALIEFMLLCALVPALWLAQNYALSGRPLDFLNGPYSAKAIEAKTTIAGGPPHPGTGSLTTAAIFFLKAAKLNVTGGYLEPLFLLVFVAGVVYAVRWLRCFGSFLLLLLPLPFYAYSIAYGSVPIFMPVWWPHSYYNVRYGLELLPAFAVFVGLAFRYAEDWGGRTAGKRVVQAVILAVVFSSYWLVSAETPICLREARANGWSRINLERRLADVLSRTPSDSVILMQTGEYVGALQRAGIRLRRVIWEGAHPEWDESLADPAKYADYVVAVKGSEVWYAARLFPARLKVFAEFDSPEKPRVVVYKVER